MRDAELDCLRDLLYEQAWEELNREDPKAKAAVEKCRLASELIDKAVALLGEAADEVENTPETDRIASLANDLEDLGCAIGAQMKRMGVD